MKLEKKYGLLTAIGMVVGVVIGSGVFYKAQTILQKTEGNMPLGILAWIIGGVVMIICALAFAIMATKYEKVNGLVDYTEVTCGNKYAYFMAWFMVTIYSPAMTGVLAWVSARFFGEIFGWELNSANVMTIGCLFLVASFALNSLAPKLAGKFQVSSTAIKLIPLVLMAVVGTVYGLFTTTIDFSVVDGKIVEGVGGQAKILIENFKNVGAGGFGTLLGAVVATVFAYEGWILATSINAELKNAKRNLPIALIIGSLIIMTIYITYYIGVAGGITVDVLMVGGAPYAFLQIFGNFFGTILKVFIVVSCLGTLNGLMLATARGFYAISCRNLGPKPEIFGQIDPKTNVPTNSAIVGLLFCAFWFAYFYGSIFGGWFGKYGFDSSELPIITIYGMYIPVFIMLVVKEGSKMGVVKGYIIPILAIVSCCFMVFAAIYTHQMSTLYYMILYIIIMGIGAIFLYIKPKTKQLQNEII